MGGCIPDCQGILGKEFKFSLVRGRGWEGQNGQGPGPSVSQASPTGKGSAGLSLTRGRSGDVGAQPPMLSTQLKFKGEKTDSLLAGAADCPKTACGTRTLCGQF